MMKSHDEVMEGHVIKAMEGHMMLKTYSHLVQSLC